MAGEVPLEEYRKALCETVKEKVRWSIVFHLLLYVMINVLVIVYNVSTGGDYVQYVLWVVIPWGVGLVCHYLSIHSIGRNLEEYEAIAKARTGGQ